MSWIANSLRLVEGGRGGLRGWVAMGCAVSLGWVRRNRRSNMTVQCRGDGSWRVAGLGLDG